MANADQLHSLAETWERRAIGKLKCGEKTADEMGRRLVDHGAMCYFNCAQELKAILAELSPPISPTSKS